MTAATELREGFPFPKAAPKPRGIMPRSRAVR